MSTLGAIPLIIRLLVFQMSILEHLRVDILRFLNRPRWTYVSMSTLSTLEAFLIRKVSCPSVHLPEHYRNL